MNTYFLNKLTIGRFLLYNNYELVKLNWNLLGLCDLHIFSTLPTLSYPSGLLFFHFLCRPLSVFLVSSGDWSDRDNEQD